jgi:hypothetical protein
MIFTEEQRAMQDATRRFSRERLLPFYQQREREGRVDRAFLQELGKLGLLGMDLAAIYGGMDANAVTTGLIVEELAYGDFNVGSLAVVQSLCGAVLERNADPRIKQIWLPKSHKGTPFWHSRSPSPTRVPMRRRFVCARSATATITFWMAKRHPSPTPIAPTHLLFLLASGTSEPPRRE